MMARNQSRDTLPEGADSVIDTIDSPASMSGGTATTEPEPSRTRRAKDKLKAEASTLKSQATDKARGYANQGKAKASGALTEVSQAMDSAANDVDARFGEQYGEYARMAAGAVSSFASRLEAKDVDDILRDAEDLVRKSPIVAIGIAAVAGFAIARLIKAGFGDGGADRRGGAGRA